MAQLNQKQREIAAGVAVAIVYTCLVLWIGATFWQVGPDVSQDRLMFALPWLVLPGLCLLAAVGRIAQSRFFDHVTIDGNAPPQGSAMEIDLRFLANTHEQVVLAFIGWLALAYLLPPAQLGVIPMLAMSFVFARLCFWVGYHRSGPARAFGFAATFYPTVASYIWVIILVLA